MSDQDVIQLVIKIEEETGAARMNQYASIVLTAIGEGGLDPQAAVDFATMEWGMHPEWDWATMRLWEEWGGEPGGLDAALLMLAKYIAAASG